VRHAAPQEDLDDGVDLALVFGFGSGCRVAGGLLFGEHLLGRLLVVGREGAGAQAAGRDHSGRAVDAAAQGLAPGHMFLVASIVVGIHRFVPVQLPSWNAMLEK